MTTFVELCAGLASVTLSLLELKPPVSRIGAKTGYVDAIRRHLCLTESSVDRVVLVDKDFAVCNVLDGLLDASEEDRQNTLERLSAYARMKDPKFARAHAGKLRGATGPLGVASWLVWTASSRGGIGGFKGAHKSRPSVDGFIPSRESLCRRVERFYEVASRRSFELSVVWRDAQLVAPAGDSVVYIDPPYDRTQGYDESLAGAEVQDVARLWRKAGALVGVSERSPHTPEGCESYNITAERRGQKRRSMTRSSEEWITVG